MKQKLFMMLAALMLMGTSAMAQSETLKGDVNADGAVDVADINAVIKIMIQEAEDNEGTKLYWYVGNTSPEGMTPPSIGDANAELCQWTPLVLTVPGTYVKVYKEDENYDDHTWYVAAPTAAGFEVYNYGDSLPDGGVKKVKTFMIGSVSYDLWSARTPGYNMAITLHK
jgi:hypothetical protein